MTIKEDMRERKVPSSVGVGAIGVVEVRVEGITVSATVLGPSGIFVVKEINVTNNQRIVPGEKI